MHALQRRQSCLVLLMVFIMGWSSVVVASVKNMHAGMIQTAFQSVQHDSDAAPCHRRAIQTGKDRISGHALQHSNQNMMHCHQDTQLNAWGISQPDQDCHQLHCQNLNYYVEYLIPALPLQTVFAVITAFHADHQFQHFSGFWLEILRPPKA